MLTSDTCFLSLDRPFRTQSSGLCTAWKTAWERVAVLKKDINQTMNRALSPPEAGTLATTASRLKESQECAVWRSLSDWGQGADDSSFHLLPQTGAIWSLLWGDHSFLWSLPLYYILEALKGIQSICALEIKRRYHSWFWWGWSRYRVSMVCLARGTCWMAVSFPRTILTDLQGVWKCHNLPNSCQPW